MNVQVKEKNINRTTLRTIDKIFKVIVITLMVLYAISLFLPILWMVYTSIKHDNDFILYPLSFPGLLREDGTRIGVHFENYADLIRKFNYTVTKEGVGLVQFGIVEMFLYSMIWCIGTPLIQTFFLCLCGYIMQHYKFPGRELLYFIGIVLMITPIVGTMPAQMVLYKKIGLYDNLIGQILKSGSGQFYGVHFLLFHAAWKSIHWAYAEAAYIDGANNFQVFTKVMFPMIIPTFVTIFVLGFITAWNDYSTFLVWLPSYPNIALGLYMFQYNAALYMIGTPTLLAGFTVAAIPTTTMYLIFRKTIMSKFTVGGLKG